MSVVDIKINEAQLAQIRQMLAGFPKAMPRILVGAINRVARQAKTDTAKEIAKTVALKRKTILGKIRMSKATKSRLAASLYMDDSPVSLHHFGARQTKKGVTYKIGKQGGRKLLPHGFIQAAKNADLVFKRLAPGDDPRGRVDKHAGAMPSARRYPIGVQRGPGVRELFGADSGLQRRLQSGINQNLMKNVDAQVKKYLWARQKFGGQK